MIYDIAKQLKDAGFPQKQNIEEKYVGDIGNREYVYYHTLSELIEACGDRFDSLEQILKSDSTFWEARWKLSRPTLNEFMQYIGGGSSPEEAVAKLWLVLHQQNEDPHRA